MDTTLELQRSDDLIVELAHPDDGYALVGGLRSEDIIEARAMLGDAVDIGNLLRATIETSHEAFSLITENRVIHALWGHGKCTEETEQRKGWVWFVSTPDLFRTHSLTMCRFANKVLFPQFDEIYDAYGNWVHADNSKHLRFLSACGFNAKAKKTFPTGKDFVYMERSN